MKRWGGEGGGVTLFYGIPLSLTGDETFRAIFSKEYYQKDIAAVVCDQVHKAPKLSEN